MKGIHEGWYIEYKSELTKPHALAKSISSFANQFGGWLFLGVAENRESHTAGFFNGIQDSDVTRALASLRDASKDLLNPSVFYEHKVLAGPVESIGLQQGRSIVVVRVPEGPDTPYVHNNGRIYRRVDDSSNPIPEKDRATLDLLFDKGEKKRAQLKSRILRSPEISEGESNRPFVHLSIFSDPYEIKRHWFNGNIQVFGELMMRNPIPFDNIFPSVEGFVARQVSNNPISVRTLTWEFSRHCHSFVTIPISILATVENDETWLKFDIGKEFPSILQSRDLSDLIVLDLNRLYEMCVLVIARHRTLAGQADVTGPFYVKAYIENVWRTSPFVDLADYNIYVRKYGLPLVQESEILAPMGTSLATFIQCPDSKTFDSQEFKLNADSDEVFLEDMGICYPIFLALGLPNNVFRGSGERMAAEIIKRIPSVSDS